MLRDSEDLLRWVVQIEKEFGVKVSECGLLDADEVEYSFDHFDLLQTDVVYHLRVFNVSGMKDLKERRLRCTK